MKTSQKLNGLLRRHSADAALVMLSLPAEPKDDFFPASPSRARPPSQNKSGRATGARGGADLLVGNLDGGGSGGGGASASADGFLSHDLEGECADGERGPTAGDDGLWAVPSEASASSVAYLELLESLTEGLDRLVMIRGGGSEVVTIFN